MLLELSVSPTGFPCEKDTGDVPDRVHPGFPCDMEPEADAVAGSPVLVGIRSIRPLGVRPVWQVVMPPPWHNYVLEGVVSANSHAVAYGEIAYQMAWVRAHYPAQFWAAFLSHEDDLDGSLGVSLSAARRQGVTVLPPDINLSLVAFTSAPGVIRCGLGIIRGIGQNLGAEIVAARQEGPFRSMSDFLRRVPAAGRRIPLTNLILAGALDSFPGTRPEKLARVTAASGRGAGVLVQVFQDPPSLGGRLADPAGQAAVDPSSDWSVERKLDGEREATGDYLTGHPLALYRPVLSAAGVHALSGTGSGTDLAEGSMPGAGPGAGRLVAGIVRSVTHRKTRRGGMVVLTVDDETMTRTATLTGEIPPDRLPQKGDRVVLRLAASTGGFGGQRDCPVPSASSFRLPSRLHVSAVMSLDDYLSGLSEIHLLVAMAFPGGELSGNPAEGMTAALDRLAARHPGRTRLRLVFADGATQELAVDCRRELILQLRGILPAAFRETGGGLGADTICGEAGVPVRSLIPAPEPPPETPAPQAGLEIRPFHPPFMSSFRR